MRLSLLAVAALLAVSPVNAAETPTSVVTTEKVPETTTKYVPKFNALLQAWSVNDNTAAAAQHLNFRLRRAELKASGNVVENARYFVMIDPAKTIRPDLTNSDGKILQDIGVAFTVVPGLEVTAGQFKVLSTAEGLASSAELLLPERSVGGRKYGDYREPGLMVSYAEKTWKLSAMASNGQGTNLDSKSDTKDLSLRVDVTPIKDLKVGAFALLGDLRYSKKGRWGVNAGYKFGDLSVTSEFATGKDGPITGAGIYVEAAYAIRDFVPVARFEVFRPDVNKGVDSHGYTLGVNYLLSKHQAKLQAALSYLDNLTGANGSPKVQSGQYGTLATLVFQAAI